MALEFRDPMFGYACLLMSLLMRAVRTFLELSLPKLLLRHLVFLTFPAQQEGQQISSSKAPYNWFYLVPCLDR
ncbi:hypothetical protein B0J12DRAFT_652998 [Macrophomina phaseolina]|uniref:Secreted protein n=1 Tax=Macrophomina phaseolina TaxID=35725 RepID=A0ABQ8GIA8_9PEZI|nr:hypothetical protein B0J12DRAFT_652998 [Macrophomina phaseolina]